MKFVKAILSIVFAICFLAACNPSDTAKTKVIDEINTNVFKNNPGINIKVVKLDSGSYGDYYQDQNIVIRNADKFKKFWKKLHQNRNPIPDRPSINFSKKMLLFTIRETKPTGGYSTEISKVVKTNDALAVKVSNTNPGEGCFTTQALTTPYQLVKVDNLDLSVKFYKKTTVQPCGS